MNATKIVAILLILAGIAGLIYRSFTYTDKTHETKVGPIEVAVKEKETVQIPVWVSAGAIVIGAGILLAGARKKA